MEISFCITTYNRLTDLKKAVNSVLDQNGLENIDYELLVSDDSNNDETEKYVLALSSENAKVRYLKNKNKGQFNNLNNVSSHAKYDWIVFLHDDDVLEKDYLSSVLLLEDKIINEGVDIVWGARNLIDKDDKKINVLVSSVTGLNKSLIVNSEEFLHQMLAKHDYTYGGRVIFPMVTGIMVKRELVLRVKFDNRFAVNADGLFLWKIFFNSKNSLYINSPIINYRWVENSERAKPSEQGIVYGEMKGILLAMIAYMEENLGVKNMVSRKNDFMNSFYFNAANIDSPITWVSLRYKGGYIKRVRIVLHIIFDIIKNYPKVLIKPSLYLCTVVCFLPQSVLKFFYRYYIKRII
jgi:glycosyltransferase involved in cell wall biosynthesis